MLLQAARASCGPVGRNPFHTDGQTVRESRLHSKPKYEVQVAPPLRLLPACSCLVRYQTARIPPETGGELRLVK